MSGVGSVLRVALSAVLTGLVIAACAPRPEPDSEADGQSGEDDANGPSDPAGSQEAPRVERSIGPDATLSLTISPGSATVGEPIRFELTLSNDGTDELVVDFPDGQRFDFEVRQGDTPLWRWAADMFFTQMIGRERVEAGGEMHWSATLESGLAAGDYAVRATLTSSEPHTVELPFTIR